MDVSILIPTRNRCEPLGQTLASLRAMAHDPGDHEIIVIDNGSTDGTRVLVEQEAAARPAVRYVHEPMPGLLSGRHRGAQEAHGDVCAYLDDDVWVGREWLTGLKEAFADPGVALVGGPSAPRFETEAPAWLDEFYAEDERARYCGWLSLIDAGTQIKEIDPCLVWGLNYAIRKSAIEALGGFHPDNIPKALQRYQGDGETGLSLRVKRAGLTALYHPRVSVEHSVLASRLTVGYFEERAFYQGVCNSFTEVRAAGAVNGTVLPNTGPVGWLKQVVGDVVRGAPTEAETIKRRTSAVYRAGYAFHQDEVRRDPQLLEWVLRPDYWQYQLPAGWERYLNAARPAR